MASHGKLKGSFTWPEVNGCSYIDWLNSKVKILNSWRTKCKQLKVALLN